MTNDRAREVAKKILVGSSGGGAELSGAEAAILAYRDEVRREVLMEAAARIEYCIAVERGAQAKGALRDAGEYIAAMSPASAETTAAINTSGDTVVIENETVVARYPAGCLHPFHCARNVPPYCAHPGSACPHAKPSTTAPSRDADLDTVWRTLAQAYVGNDYTIEGRKFQAAVERLWPR